MLFQAFEVLPSDEDVCFWKAILTGPESTPYEGGCWMICMYFPPSYPSIAPEIRFITPIQHCNINSHGRVRDLGERVSTGRGLSGYQSMTKVTLRWLPHLLLPSLGLLSRVARYLTRKRT